MHSAFDNLLIVPHESVAKVDCCGCLMVRIRDEQADIVCNECGAVTRPVALGDVEAAMLGTGTDRRSLQRPVPTLCSVYAQDAGVEERARIRSAVETLGASTVGLRPK